MTTVNNPNVIKCMTLSMELWKVKVLLSLSFSSSFASSYKYQKRVNWAFCYRSNYSPEAIFQVCLQPFYQLQLFHLCEPQELPTWLNQGMLADSKEGGFHVGFLFL
jgi:hypothetical protein